MRRFLDRLGAGTRSAPRNALIAASVDEPNRGRAFGLEGVSDNAGAFLGPLLAVLLLIVFHLDIRLVFYLAVIPGLLAFLMVLLVEERPVEAIAKSRIDISLGRFPRAYWKYLLATALFGIGNSSNAFLILQTKEIGASLTMTILIYAGFNLVAALISYPAGFLSEQIGQEDDPGAGACHLPGHLSRLRLGRARHAHRRAFRLVRALSGDIPLSRQSFGERLRTRATPRQRGRLVQHDCGVVRLNSQPCRRMALGLGRPCHRVSLRRSFRCGRQHRIAGVGSGEPKA
jgi:MFS family permease